jgi:hypothetical protein
MINVGCKFGPDDLSPDTWDGLILIARERQKISNKIDDARRRKEPEQLPKEAQKKVDTLRKETGIPPPGQSIFAQKKMR